jgi:hypothetical protein
MVAKTVRTGDLFIRIAKALPAYYAIYIQSISATYPIMLKG